MRVKRQRDPRDLYVDPFGRGWSLTKLDALLTDETVMMTVLAGVNVCLRPNGTWDRPALHWWSQVRFPRLEAAALLAVLVERYFDTEGARYLDRRRAA